MEQHREGTSSPPFMPTAFLIYGPQVQLLGDRSLPSNNVLSVKEEVFLED